MVIELADQYKCMYTVSGYQQGVWQDLSWYALNKMKKCGLYVSKKNAAWWKNVNPQRGFSSMPQSSDLDLALCTIFINDLHKNEENIPKKPTDDTIMIAILCKYFVW